MNPNFATKLSLATATACFLGAFAAAAFAGPPSGSYLRPVAPITPAKAATAVCSGCKTTPIVVANSVGPAGKGHVVWTKVGTKHECAFCSGAIVAKTDGTTDRMNREAMKCGPKACCVAATK